MSASAVAGRPEAHIGERQGASSRTRTPAPRAAPHRRTTVATGTPAPRPAVLGCALRRVPRPRTTRQPEDQNRRRTAARRPGWTRRPVDPRWCAPRAAIGGEFQGAAKTGVGEPYARDQDEGVGQRPRHQDQKVVRPTTWHSSWQRTASISAASRVSSRPSEITTRGRRNPIVYDTSLRSRTTITRPSSRGERRSRGGTASGNVATESQPAGRGSSRLGHTGKPRP